MPRPRPHDDHLREQLLGIATETIARTGVEGLSLRTLATDAGTSTSAVYQLFGSRAALLDAEGPGGVQSRPGRRPDARGLD